jgi:phage baseplate assembly protein W
MAYIDISNNTNEKIYNDDTIHTSILNILYTRLGELPGLPEFGSRLYDFVFELEDQELELMFKEEVAYVLRKWEPRITIKNIDVKLDTDYNKVICRLFYSLNKDIRDEVTSRTISFTMTRR